MSTALELRDYIPALRRYARIVVVNKVIADQLVKECIEDNLGNISDHSKAKADQGIRKKLFFFIKRA